MTLVVERYKGSLLDALERRDVLAVGHQQWALKMASLCGGALQELHEISVIHRDAAARNFLLQSYIHQEGTDYGKVTRVCICVFCCVRVWCVCVNSPKKRRPPSL